MTNSVKTRIKSTSKMLLFMILRNQMKIKSMFMLKSKHDNRFLFILSPPYGGSTLLNQIISSSNSVSVNNPFGTREGQRLPKVIDLMFNHKRRWDKDLDFDWIQIKKEWLKYWDLTKPILLEKSPPNIIRAKSISNHFKPSFFIIFFRNPYALCESYMRRSKLSPKDAAAFTLQCLNYQKKNIEILNDFIVVSYEELTTTPDLTISKLSEFLPQLGNIRISTSYSAHNYQNKNLAIKNLNEEKIKNLSRNDLLQINEVFDKNKDLITFFNYKIINL